MTSTTIMEDSYMRTKTALFIFLAAWHVCGQSPNLIQGDSGAETTDRDLAYGTWNSCNQYHGRKEFHNWIRDTSVAFQGKSSIRLNRGRISMNELVPPAGTYTFSFYAKAMENGTECFLSVHPWKRSTYATLESNAKKVVFSNEWKRYS